MNSSHISSSPREIILGVLMLPVCRIDAAEKGVNGPSDAARVGRNKLKVSRSGLSPPQFAILVASLLAQWVITYQHARPPLANGVVTDDSSAQRIANR